ncbi:MAG: class A beta-lactamase-related serine hydrolase [Acidipropionibacterium jensenii]|uniref:serine hydrolase n=1 Tax=Acidipropionibacterium jensenii TaxID=1749 RepID=UPI00264A0D06|nr:serine hydrolase [Acidipropionibacterium jensenii]MDN6513665.1 class A beta-lactamase-related serine hydrolase [Acidipropionibacterium jensenii]
MTISCRDIPQRLREVAGVRWSARAVDIDSGQLLAELDPDRVQDTASVGKIFMLHRLLHEVDAGRRSLEDRVTRRPAEWMDNSGLWYLLQQNDLSLYDVAALIGAVSDNAATNTLVRVIGLDVVQQHTRELGYRDSGLDDCVRWPIPPGAPRTLSHGTAAELVRFCARLARGQDLSRSSADVLQRWLGAGMDLSMVASAFGLDPLAHYYFDRDIWLWNKTGTIGVVRADIGVVMSPRRRIGYAVLANWDRSVQVGEGVRDEVLAAMADVGRALRTELAG